MKESAAGRGNAIAALGAAAALLLCTPSVTHADAVMTLNVTVTPDNGEQPYSETAKIYSKDNLARVDEDGQATIFDGQNRKVTVADSASKTYYSMPLRDWQALGRIAEPLGDNGPGPEPNKTVGLSKTDDIPGNARSVGDFTARKYFIKASLGGPGSPPRFNVFDLALGGGFGRHGGGFGFSAAGVEGGRRYYGGPGLIATLSGEVWLSQSEALSDEIHNSSLAEALAAAWATGALTEDLAKKMQKEGGIPLYSRVSVTRPYRSDDGDTTTVETRVTALSLQPVLYSAFAVPPTYTQVLEPPGEAQPPGASEQSSEPPSYRPRYHVQGDGPPPDNGDNPQAYNSPGPQPNDGGNPPPYDNGGPPPNNSDGPPPYDNGGPPPDNGGAP